MRLYDTARREVVAFEPGPLVTMYSCGITPYDAAHLGHAAVYLYFDLLQRRLRDAGHETKLVRNVTDVDDDILRKARELGVHYLDLAAEEMARFDAERGLLKRERSRLRVRRLGVLQRGDLSRVRAHQRVRAGPDARARGRARRASG